MGDERKPWEEEGVHAEDSLSRDMSCGQMSEMREEELVVGRHMRAAFSGGLALQDRAGSFLWQVPEKGERANVELCPQMVLPSYLRQYWKISFHSFSLFSPLFVFLLWINIDYEG